MILNKQMNLLSN